MNSFNIAKQGSLIIIIGFLVVLATMVAILFPQYQRLEGVKGDISSRKKILDNETQYFDNIKEIEVKLEERKKQFFNIESALPDYPSIPSLFKYIQEESSYSGLLIDNMGAFSINDPDIGSGIREIKFNIAVIGSYSAFKNFISTLETSARMIEIESIAFSSSKKSDTLTFSLQLKTFAN